MALNIRILKARDFIRARPDGALDFETSQRLLREVARKAEGLADYGIILDVRAADSSLSEVDLWYLASDIAGLNDTFRHRTAVLAPPHRFDHARFFAMAAQNRGLNVRAFETYDQAVEWLHEDDG